MARHPTPPPGPLPGAAAPPARASTPGRRRVPAFFKALYGATEAEVRANPFTRSRQVSFRLPAQS